MSARPAFSSIESDLQLEANGDIQEIRERVATLWWYADSPHHRTTPEGASQQMARAVCEIGFTLNLLSDKLRMLSENFEAAMREGGGQ